MEWIKQKILKIKERIPRNNKTLIIFQFIITEILLFSSAISISFIKKYNETFCIIIYIIILVSLLLVANIIRIVINEFKSYELKIHTLNVGLKNHKDYKKEYLFLDCAYHKLETIHSEDMLHIERLENIINGISLDLNTIFNLNQCGLVIRKYAISNYSVDLMHMIVSIECTMRLYTKMSMAKEILPYIEYHVVGTDVIFSAKSTLDGINIKSEGE